MQINWYLPQGKPWTLSGSVPLRRNGVFTALMSSLTLKWKFISISLASLDNKKPKCLDPINHESANGFSM